MNYEEEEREVTPPPVGTEPDWRKLAGHYESMKYFAVSRAEQLKRISNARETIASATSNLEQIVDDMAEAQAKIDELMGGAK